MVMSLLFEWDQFSGEMNMKMNVDLTYYSRVIMDGEEDDDDGMEQRTDMHSKKKSIFVVEGWLIRSNTILV